MPDLTPEMLAELRRLAEAGPLRPWRAGTVDGVDYGSVWGAVARRDDGLFTSPMIVDDVSMWPGAAELIAAAVNALPALLDAADERAALAAKVERVREWAYRRGVNVGDRDDDYMRGYRDAQRHALMDVGELLHILDGGAES